MGYKWKKKAILAKIETAYGTDPTPTGAANAMLTLNGELTPLDGESVKREIELPYYGNSGQILIKTHATLTFDVEMAGSGAAGTQPAYGPLLRGCGFAETITALTKVEYAPVSDNQESLGIYFQMAGTKHILLGARGSVRATVNANGLPVWRFNFKGLLGTITSAVLPAVTVTGFKAPQVSNKTNTSIFSVHGYACTAQSFDMDVANQIEGRFLIGQETIELVDRVPTGSVNIVSPDIATKDFFALALNRTRGAIQIKHGVGAGNIISFDLPAVEIGRPGYGQDQGEVMMTLPLDIAPVTGNDEIKVTFT